MTTSAAITTVMMTKEEAKATRDKINNHVGATAALLKDLFNREGWRALGYKSWKDCAEKEFNHSRARIQQILIEAKVEKSLGPGAPPLSSRATRELKDVKPGKRKAALKAAQKQHRTKTPTAPQIKSTVTTNRAFAPSGVSNAKPAKPITEQAKTDEALQKALAILGGTVSRPFREAIESGKIDMPRADVITLSEETDEIMLQTALLVTQLQWSVKQCLKFLNHMPTEQDKIEVLTHLAIASPDGKFEGSFGAFHITVLLTEKRKP